MTIYELRDLIDQTGDIDNIPLRCATYSRVSTEKETQAASLHNMTDDFRDYVERHPNWTFVKAFIDDGRSGLTTKKREDFLKLLAAGAAGSYDLLITGEISRFGRNTMEGLQNIKYLKDRGIPVIFLYDDLNTYDADCDIQIQQKLVDAENESRKISKRVKRGHAKSIQKGHVLGNRIWGYKKENCKLVIDPETAPMVRRIFELYATNQHSMKEIEEIAANGPKSEDIEKHREFMLKSWKNSLEQNGAWMNYIQIKYGSGLNYIADHEQAIRDLTNADVQALAKKILADGNLVKVVMRPSK